MRIVVSIFFLLLLVSCGIFKKKKASDDKQTKTDEPVEKKEPGINGIIATNGSLGNLVINNELDHTKLSNDIDLVKSKADASFFGFDGGGEATLFSAKGQPVAAIVTNDKNEITAIVAIHSGIRTDEGLSVRSSLSRISSAYPDGELAEDEMNNWSVYHIPDKNWQFIFDISKVKLKDDDRSMFMIIK